MSLIFSNTICCQIVVCIFLSSLSSVSASEKKIQKPSAEIDSSDTVSLADMQREIRLLNRKVLQLQKYLQKRKNKKPDADTTSLHHRSNTSETSEDAYFNESPHHENPNHDHSISSNVEDTEMENIPLRNRTSPLTQQHSEQKHHLKSASSAAQAEKISHAGLPQDDSSEPHLLSIDKIISELPQGWVMGTPPSLKARTQSPIPDQDSAKTSDEFNPSSQSNTAPTSIPSSHTQTHRLSPIIFPNRVGPTPHTSSALHEAKTLLQEKKFALARQAFVDLVKDIHSPDYPSAMYWFGMLNLHENNLEQAALWFEKTLQWCSESTAIEAKKLCVAALLRLSMTFFRENNPDRARYTFRSCQKRAKDIQPFLPAHIQSALRTMKSLLKKTKKSAAARHRQQEGYSRVQEFVGDSVQKSRNVKKSSHPSDESDQYSDDSAAEVE